MNDKDGKYVFVVSGGLLYESSSVYGVFEFKHDAERFKKRRFDDEADHVDYLTIEKWKLK